MDTRPQRKSSLSEVASKRFPSLDRRRPIDGVDEPLSLVASSEIENRIRHGVLKPGEQLPSETNLAKVLGVNRLTLREALCILKEKGMVDVLHGRGTYVASKRHLSQALEARDGQWEGDACDVFAIEQQNAVKWTTLIGDPGILVPLSSVEREIIAIGESCDANIDGLIDNVGLMHQLIAEGSRNKFLVALNNCLWRTVACGIRGRLTSNDVVRMASCCCEIVDAVSCGNSTRSKAAMKRHLRCIRRFMGHL